MIIILSKQLSLRVTSVSVSRQIVFSGYSMSQQPLYLTYNWRKKGVHAFLKSVSLKANVISRLDFELAYFEAAVEHFTHYASSSYCTNNLQYKTISTFPWYDGYRRWKWRWQHEFKSWIKLIAFHIALIPLGKVRIQLFSLQLWTDWVL